MPDNNTSRVSMVWPDSLKAKVRDRVGGRGLTDFVVEAVEAKLGKRDGHDPSSREMNEVRDLAQRLADALALGGDYEDRASALRYLQLPAWIQTIGWPEELTTVVAAEEPEPEPVEPVVEDIQHKAERPVEDVELPAIGDPGTVRSAEPEPSKGDDWVEKVRSKAAEKGVDLSGVDLKPASVIEKPEPTPEPEPEPEPEVEVQVAPEPEPMATAIANPNTCPECGTELVAGECWECFS